MDARATCIATGGLATPCTVGDVVFANPGHTYLQTNVEGTETHSMMFVWPVLARGVWRFQALPGGNGTAYIDYRTWNIQTVTP